MSADEQALKLASVLRDTGLDGIFEPGDLIQRLEEFSRTYARRVADLPLLPRAATLDVILSDYERSPHRVHALLQALAFLCSPDMLVMVWMVQLGCRIEHLEFRYDRGQQSQLDVSIVLPDRETSVNFKSRDLWDAATLKLAVLSKGDGHPYIDSFAALALRRNT